MSGLEYLWTAYITYTEADGYAWTEEFDLMAPDFEEAEALAHRAMAEGYEPGGELSLVRGPLMEKRYVHWIEVSA